MASVRIAILGLGKMGVTHAGAYARMGEVRVTAVLTRDAGKAAERVPAGARVYTDLHELLKDPEIDAVDVCLPSEQHHIAAMTAVLAGKHVLVEQPAGRTSGSIRLLARTAREAGVVAMPGMVMRFWPGFTWLKEAVTSGRYGTLASVNFRRLSAFPGTAFHRSTERSGGAILDLHLHSTDFVCHLLGVPDAVSSTGRSVVTDGIDYVVTRYEFGDGGPVVTAKGSWAMADGFPLTVSFMANFEAPGGDRTTAAYELGAAEPLKVYRGGKCEVVALPPAEGPGGAFDAELAHFVACVREKREPLVTMEAATESTAVIEAERASVASGGRSTPVRGGRLTMMV